jgi:hypothetical protein
MDSTAITGIVISGFVGPSVGAWFAIRSIRLSHELELFNIDRTEARATLDEVARQTCFRQQKSRCAQRGV